MWAGLEFEKKEKKGNGLMSPVRKKGKNKREERKKEGKKEGNKIGKNKIKINKNIR